MSIDEKFCNCVDEWAKNDFDERIEKAIEKFDSWINDFNNDDAEVVCELLKRFRYHSKQTVANIIQKLDKARVHVLKLSMQKPMAKKIIFMDSV